MGRTLLNHGTLTAHDPKKLGLVQLVDVLSEL